MVVNKCSSNFVFQRADPGHNGFLLLESDYFDTYFWYYVIAIELIVFKLFGLSDLS